MAARLDNSGRIGRLYLALAATLWSLAGVFIKFLHLNPLSIVFYRSLFASLFFAIFAKSFPRLRGALIVAIISYTAAISSFVSANKLTTAANAIVLQYTAPIFVFLIVRFLFQEKISVQTWLALCLGMTGIGMIFSDSVGQPEAAGVALALLSGLLFSVYMVSLRFLADVHAGTLIFLSNVACWTLLLPFVRSELSITLNEAVILVIMGVVQLGIPYWLFSKALENVPVQEASLIVLIEPVLNPLWVALAVGEVPAVNTFVGGALIVAGLAVRYGWGLVWGKR